MCASFQFPVRLVLLFHIRVKSVFRATFLSSSVDFASFFGLRVKWNLSLLFFSFIFSLTTARDHEERTRIILLISIPEFVTFHTQHNAQRAMPHFKECWPKFQLRLDHFRWVGWVSIKEVVESAMNEWRGCWLVGWFTSSAFNESI